MNKRKKIYRGLNKRKNNNISKVVVILTVCLMSSYGIYKVKDNIKVSFITDKFKTIKLPEIDMLAFMDKFKANTTEYEYKDLENQLNKTEKDKEVSQEVKDVSINGWEFYSIQVASIQNSNDYEKIETDLKNSKIPFSVVEIDSIKKVQTYGFISRDLAKSQLENVRKKYPDAFLAENKIPLISLQYTNKYSYIEKISTQLNILIDTFKKESEFWASNESEMNKYNEILTNRKNAIDILKKESEKIDYDEASKFKENLISYLNSIDENIEDASKAANEQNYYVSQGIYLNSMQGYFKFINSIQ